jgi:Restriction endonuclease
MRRRYYRKSNILKLSKTEKQVFEGIVELIKMLIYITIGTCRGIYELSKYIRKLVKNYRTAYNNGYDLNILLEKFNKLTPRQFEILMAELFRCQGFDEVILTKFCHDYGRDIILKRKVNGRTEVIYVECKYYAPHNTIGRDIAFKLLGSMQMFHADKGIICSTGKFHKNSIEVASSVDNLKLMGTDEIKMMLFKLNANQIQKIMFKLVNVS